MAPPPPPVNRIVTKHDPDGAAVFAPAFEVPPRLYPHKSLNGSPVPDDSDTLLYTLIWNSEFKADNCAEEDGAKARCGLSRKDGVTFRTVDFKPKSSSPMHRTETQDYGFVISGELELELEKQERKVLKAGDFFVQRGTIHKWHNRSDEWARAVFVFVAAEKVKTKDGQELGNYGLPFEEMY